MLPKAALTTAIAGRSADVQDTSMADAITTSDETDGA